MSEANECINIRSSEHGITCELSRFLASPAPRFSRKFVAERPNEIWTLGVAINGPIPRLSSGRDRDRVYKRIHPDAIGERELSVSRGEVIRVRDRTDSHTCTYASVVTYPQA